MTHKEVCYHMYEKKVRKACCIKLKDFCHKDNGPRCPYCPRSADPEPILETSELWIEEIEPEEIELPVPDVPDELPPKTRWWRK